MVKIMKYISLTVRFPAEDYQKMQRLVKKGKYVTIAEIVREAVKQFLKSQNL